MLTRLRDNDRMKLYTNQLWLTKRIIHDKKTPEEVAKECGCSAETIYVYMAKFKIKKTKRK
jgi:hypothetical protein